MPPADVERRLAAILSADVAGYSRLMADGEDATVRALRATREQVAALIAEHRGRLADFTGDNFLAEFAAARDAVECALAIQRAIEARNAALPEPRRMRFRIGAHHGDVRHEDGRPFGDGVNIAARLQPLAEPGGLCISSTLADTVRGKLPVALEDMGEQALKNIPERVRAFRVRALADGAQPHAAPSAPRPRWLAPTAAALAAIAGFAYVARGRAPAATADPVTTAPGPPAEAAPIRSIAVLPLTNLSGDPEQEFFADGMTETLIAELSKLPGVSVISRTSVMQFKGTSTPLPEIAKALNVDGVIEGSVMRAGNEVRITAQLIDARADRHLWAQQYDRELARVLEIQSEVARAVAAQIPLALTPEQNARLKAPMPVDPRARLAPGVRSATPPFAAPGPAAPARARACSSFGVEGQCGSVGIEPTDRIRWRLGCYGDCSPGGSGRWSRRASSAKRGSRWRGLKSGSTAIIAREPSPDSYDCSSAANAASNSPSWA